MESPTGTILSWQWGKGGNLRTSSDGATWTHRTKPQNYNLMGATFGNNTFVAVGYSGKIVRSTDNGETWDNATSPTDKIIYGVAFGNNTFLAAAAGANIVRSPNNGVIL